MHMKLSVVSIVLRWQAQNKHLFRPTLTQSLLRKSRPQNDHNHTTNQFRKNQTLVPQTPPVWVSDKFWMFQ